jgi:hypothetical protein
MKHIHRSLPLRLFAAMLVTVATIGLSALAMHAPRQTQSSVTLNRIQTDTSTALYADQRSNRMWFVEMVLPISDSKAASDNLRSVAATL